MIEAMVDLRIAYFTAFLEQDVTKKQELEDKLYGETFPRYLTRLNAMVEENRAGAGSSGFLVGSRLSIADLSVGAYLQKIGRASCRERV